MQRAFAAEFLVPICRLIAHLGDDFSQEAIVGAGFYFELSPLTIENSLKNQGYLARNESSELIFGFR